MIIPSGNSTFSVLENPSEFLDEFPSAGGEMEIIYNWWFFKWKHHPKHGAIMMPPSISKYIGVVVLLYAVKVDMTSI